jgi:uncharacterized protein YdeI (YjbR/CyaY-like superfamily)
MGSRTAAEAGRLRVETAAEWRRWLSANHSRSGGVWLVFDRKGTSAQTLDYGSALDEALCFGWIDSLIKNIDGRRYMRKFTPRGVKSKWSPSNKRRIGDLVKEGRMRAAGLAVVERARKDGSWERPDRIPVTDRVPVELLRALRGNPEARGNFDRLAPSHRTRYIMWICSAKLAATREKRAAEAASLLGKNEKLGLR